MSFLLLGAGRSGSAVLTFGGGAEANAFLARTSGLDATHINAYIDLIDGLVTDSVWSKLDMLHVYATKDSTTAALNLVSTSYAATVTGGPTFTVDRGFTGVNASSAVFIDTNFNPTSASSPNYIQDSAHCSAWSVSNVGSLQNPIMGAQTSGGGATSQVYPKFTDGKAYFRINDAGTLAGVTNATQTGHYIANRSGASAVQGYKNGSSILSSGADASTGVPNVSFTTIAFHFTTAPFVLGSDYQCAMASIGSSLNGTDVTNFYNRLRTYMTAVGVP